MRYEIYSRRTFMWGKQWYWRLVAANGRKIAVGAEGYHNKADCRAGIDLVRGSSLTKIREVAK